MRRAIYSAILGLAAGCAGQNAQLTSCQAEKDQLLATISTQRETTRAMGEQVASLESRLDQAEKELARAGGGTRLSSRPADPPKATPPKATTTKTESLPWRAPPAKGAADAPLKGSGQRTTNVPVALAELAKRDRALRYDAATQTARLDVPLEFRGGGATLSAADKQRLDEVSRTLRTDQARALPIVIAGGSPERAQAVADYLDSHGIAGERLIVTRRQPGGANPGISITLAGEDSPLIAEARGQALTR